MSYTQYLRRGENFEFSGDVENFSELPSGVYEIEEGMFGLYLEKIQINTDSLVDLPDSTADEVRSIVDLFLSGETKEAFSRYGILYKRGILMYGPPGTGKTCIINQLIKTAEEKNMIVLLDAKPFWVSDVVENIREIEGGSRTIMVIWEEFEKWTPWESNVLDLLDGIDQVDNVIYIAPTNYIDKIPERIRNRPSRFANVIEVGYPSAEVRRIFLESKIHKEDNVDIAQWVEATEGMTIDHLKDLIISVLVLKVPFPSALEKLKTMGGEAFSETTDEEIAEDCLIEKFATKSRLPS